MMLRILSRKLISTSTIVAALVFRVTFPPPVSMVRPSILASSSARSSATRSMTFSFAASVAVIETLLRTASSAQVAFRPRRSARPRMYGSDVGSGGHGGHVGGDGDKGAGRGRARSARRDIDDDRDRGAEDFFDDHPHGEIKAPGGIQLEDEHLGAGLFGLAN